MNRPRMKRRHRQSTSCVLGAAVLLIAAAGASAQDTPPPSQPPAPTPTPTPAPTTTAAGGLPEVTVQLKGGQRINGLLVSVDEQAVVVRVSGINTRLPMDTVDRYDVLPPIMERYEELRKTIGDDPDDIVRLAEWLQAREQYPLALTEVTRALEIEPTNAKALRLKAILEQLIVLRASPKKKTTEAAPAAETADPARRPIETTPLLSPADIGLIKVFEVDLASNPRVLIKRETMQRLMAEHAGHPLVPVTEEGREAILRRSPIEHLDLMFKLQAREFYREVEVLDTPAPVKLFRDEVQRTWLMGCATNQCHGGLEAGRLVLHNRNPGSDASVYTNLLILSRFRTTVNGRTGAGGASGAGPAEAARPLIDWDHPERSPLLHLGLPREDSLFPHPVVPRPGRSAGGGGGTGDVWRPSFQSTEDRLFRATITWMEAMYRPRPEYPVKYAPIRPFEPPRMAAPGPKPDAAPR